MSRLASLSDDVPGTTSDVTTTLTYTPGSQLATKLRSNETYAFSGYTTLSRPYVVNGLNQYTSGGAATFGYDSNGSLVTDGTTGYTYDAENRMVMTTFGGGATLVYDPIGRLYGTITGSTAIKSILYDGDQRIAEYDGTALTARYVHGAGGDNPLLWYEGSGLTDRRSLQADQQGSIVSVVDASGTTLGINSYDEYGIPGGAQLGKFQYTGQVWIPQVGMYYYKARFYSPTLGRFMQTDPIGYADQNNLYAYVGNDPIDGSDPSGLCSTGTYICPNHGTEGINSVSGGGLKPGVERGNGSSANQAKADGRSASPPGSARPGGIGGKIGSAARNVPLIRFALLLASALKALTPEPKRVGVWAYRVYGGEAGPKGKSWSAYNPAQYKNEEAMRQGLALPPGWGKTPGLGNTAESYIRGYIPQENILEEGPIRPERDPVTGKWYMGGGTEITVKDPNNIIYENPRPMTYGQTGP